MSLAVVGLFAGMALGRDGLCAQGAAPGAVTPTLRCLRPGRPSDAYPE
jgi:hypothetical protein